MEGEDAAPTTDRWGPETSHRAEKVEGQGGGRRVEVLICITRLSIFVYVSSDFTR